MAKKKLKTVFVSVDGKEHDNMDQAKAYDEEHKTNTIQYNIERAINKLSKEEGKSPFYSSEVKEGKVYVSDVFKSIARGDFDAIVRRLPKIKAQAHADYKDEYGV